MLQRPALRRLTVNSISVLMQSLRCGGFVQGVPFKTKLLTITVFVIFSDVSIVIYRRNAWGNQVAHKLPNTSQSHI
jgi:hypothetical protein